MIKLKVPKQAIVNPELTIEVNELRADNLALQQELSNAKR
jgi:FtsZ-binding cell division protein ZapB